MTVITSLQNPRVKDAVRLRDARHRATQRRILIDGVRELRRAIAAGVPLVEVFVCEELAQGDECRQLLATLPGCGGEILPVSRAVLAKLAFGHRSEGVLAVAQMPHKTLAEMPLDGNPLVAVLEGIEKPGNIGAVARSADGAGLSAVIVAEGRTDLYNPNAIRASLGTLFALPVCEAEGSDVLSLLRGRKLHIVAARVDGSVPYTEIDYRGPTALVLGERDGRAHHAVVGRRRDGRTFAHGGSADSLNVSATAAILFYEAQRQREGTPCPLRERAG